MKINFWGVRGSIPSPGANTVKYGGNTSCLELCFPGSEKLIIIDAGSGIWALGNHLTAQYPRGGPIRADIFLTHTHLDHILGFPFFAPIYMADTQLNVYGPVTCEDDSLEVIMGGQLSYRYFPVRQAELAAAIKYIDLKEGCFDLGGGIRLITKYLNHPQLCLGYRFEYRGKVFCTAYDTEPFYNLFSTDPQNCSYDVNMAHEGERTAREENRRMEEFFAGADLLVHDAQYIQEEYAPDMVGWGHTPVQYAIAAAKRAGVRRLALFHHEPTRTDAELEVLSRKYCDPENGGPMEVFFAREGMQVEL
ncbi:MAG: MBL fold metallo-hydrolase [Desulfobacterales bacterium]|nr:MAG: MBL fold metallo-hydrolase [Desulfobacterales bacterium]